MPFIIPGDNDRFRHRMKRAQHAQEEQERRRHEVISRQIALRESQEEARRWKERMTFDLYLLAGVILDRLEDQRDRNVPKSPDDEWNEQFCEAVRLIPEARRFLEKMSIEIIDGGKPR